MLKVIVALALAGVLSGCVIAPDPYYHPRPCWGCGYYPHGGFHGYR